MHLRDRKNCNNVRICYFFGICCFIACHATMIYTNARKALSLKVPTRQAIQCNRELWSRNDVIKRQPKL